MPTEENQWVIEGPYDENDKIKLYWSNEDGFVDLASATAFTTQEMQTLNLPIGAVQWVQRSRAEGGEHEHKFGPFQRSRLAGTPHRPCLVVGCRTISLDGDDA